MATKYIVNNSDNQELTGSISISGKTMFLSPAPAGVTGSPGDKMGELAFDTGYIYYCTGNFVEGGFVITSDGPEHIFNNNVGIGWNGYYSPPSGNYLQTGFLDTGDENFAPQNGWYIVDDIGEIRQVIGGFWLSPEQPAPNGAGWIMTLDGNFTISPSRENLTFYETLPTVTFNEGSGNIWKSVKLDPEKTTTSVYRALLTQTSSITGNSLPAFNFGLVKGETYTISSYIEGDDFSNIANVTSGTINQTGCVFIATGETPINWQYGSELVSDGGLVVQVVENTLGYDIDWTWKPFGGYGYYIGVNNTTGPLINSFPRQSTLIKGQSTTNPFYGFPTYNIVGNPVSYSNKDEAIGISVVDYSASDQVDNALYYTPVEILINQDLNENTMTISGTINEVYPFSYASVRLTFGQNSIDSFYGPSDQVANIDELISVLNSSQETNFLGTFGKDENGEIIITMKSNLKNQFCPDGTLTFEIFAD